MERGRGLAWHATHLVFLFVFQLTIRDISRLARDREPLLYPDGKAPEPYHVCLEKVTLWHHKALVY